MNVAVIVGEVLGDVHRSVRDDGSVVVSFDVVVSVEGDGSTMPARASGRTVVPVTWFGSAEKTPKVETGTLVTAIGGVRRRFYRRGGATVARTDVLADRVIPGPPGRSRRARAKMAEAVASG